MFSVYTTRTATGHNVKVTLNNHAEVIVSEVTPQGDDVVVTWDAADFLARPVAPIDGPRGMRIGVAEVHYLKAWVTECLKG